MAKCPNCGVTVAFHGAVEVKCWTCKAAFIVLWEPIMLDDKKRAELEQSLAGINETLPLMWWALYSGCVKCGFSTIQAIVLVQSQILSGAPHGINGTSKAPDDPKPEDSPE